MIHTHFENNIAVLRLELNKTNTFSLSDIGELTKRIDNIEKNQNCKGIILTGTNRVFSAGAEITALIELKSDEMVNRFFREMDNLLIRLFSLKKLLIVAINGHSIGLGFLIQLCADCVVSHNNIKIKYGLPESKIGLTLDSVMQELLNWNNINGKLLSNLLLNGDLFNVNYAIDLKTIDIIAKESEIISTAKNQVDVLLKNNPHSFQINKMLLRKRSLNQMQSDFDIESYTVYSELFASSKTKNKIDSLRIKK